MSKQNTELLIAFQSACAAITKLECELSRIEKIAPALFFRPLREMGASDKMAIAANILNILKTEETEL